MSALRVVLVFTVIGLLVGVGFGFARYREAQNNAPAATPTSTAQEVAADPLNAEAARAGLEEGRLVVNHMGVRVVCGRAHGRPAVYSAGRLYTPDGEDPDTYISQWEHWCSPAATEPVGSPGAITSAPTPESGKGR